MVSITGSGTMVRAGIPFDVRPVTITRLVKTVLPAEPYEQND
jgi:hypothetical protein